MKQKLLTLTVFLLSSIFLTLCTNSTEPKENLLPEKEYEPGTRDYTWRIDTLNNDAPYNYFTKIWGSSPNDIWIVGGGPTENMQILRYNGESIYSIYDIDITSTPWSVFGFDSNDVWIGGSNFDFKHYDGTSLTLNNILYKKDYIKSAFSDIWGTSHSHLMAAGGILHSMDVIYGVVMIYNGVKWEYAEEPIPNLQFTTLRKSLYEDDYFLLGFKLGNNSPDSSFFYRYNGDEISKLDIGTSYPPSKKYIGLMDETIYFINNKIIYKLWDGAIKQKISLANTIASSERIIGRDEKDFFIQCDGGIGHYNGSNLALVYNIDERFGIVDGIVFENEIFIIGFYKDSLIFFLIKGQKNINDTIQKSIFNNYNMY